MCEAQVTQNNPSNCSKFFCGETPKMRKLEPKHALHHVLPCGDPNEALVPRQVAFDSILTGFCISSEERKGTKCRFRSESTD